jgi:hypothetical protein
MWGTIRAGQKGYFPMSVLRCGGVSQKIKSLTDRLPKVQAWSYRWEQIEADFWAGPQRSRSEQAAAKRLLHPFAKPFPNSSFGFLECSPDEVAGPKNPPPHSESFSLKMV